MWLRMHKFLNCTEHYVISWPQPSSLSNGKGVKYMYNYHARLYILIHVVTFLCVGEQFCDVPSARKL